MDQEKKSPSFPDFFSIHFSDVPAEATLFSSFSLVGGVSFPLHYCRFRLYRCLISSLKFSLPFCCAYCNQNKKYSSAKCSKNINKNCKSITIGQIHTPIPLFRTCSGICLDIGSHQDDGHLLHLFAGAINGLFCEYNARSHQFHKTKRKH
jgi:hypothetical protein